MLTPTVAHAGQPLAPHDLWSAWNADPVLVAGLVLAAWAYRRGRARGGGRPADSWRAACFTGALAALAVALLSPLDALSSVLASAHMVQHQLLVLVAAPLLALSAPSSALLRGSPLAVRARLGRLRRRLQPAARVLRVLREPVAVWLLHVATLWFWHAAVPYQAALTDGGVHALEHASFLLTGVLFWRVVVGGRSGIRIPAGLGIVAVFAMALQSAFLAVLLTFARAPWYEAYAATQRWRLDPLADQQLAGVLMWVPGGLVYVVVALVLLVTWIRTTEDAAARDEERVRTPV